MGEFAASGSNHHLKDIRLIVHNDILVEEVVVAIRNNKTNVFSKAKQRFTGKEQVIHKKLTSFFIYSLAITRT